MTRTGRRGFPILDGVKTAVAAACVDVRPATRSAFRRGLAQTPPDFPSALAPQPHPAHTGRPDSLPSPLLYRLTPADRTGCVPFPRTSTRRNDDDSHR